MSLVLILKALSDIKLTYYHLIVSIFRSVSQCANSKQIIPEIVTEVSYDRV